MSSGMMCSELCFLKINLTVLLKTGGRGREDAERLVNGLLIFYGQNGGGNSANREDGMGTRNIENSN